MPQSKNILPKKGRRSQDRRSLENREVDDFLRTINKELRKKIANYYKWSKPYEDGYMIGFEAGFKVGTAKDSQEVKQLIANIR